MQTLVATEDVIRAAEQIYRDFEIAKLKAYQARLGNPNQIDFARFGEAIATLGPYVGYFNRVYGVRQKEIPLLPEMVRFYEPTRTNFELTVSPLDACMELSEALVSTGFCPGYYHAKFSAPLPLVSLSHEPSRVAVSRVEVGELDEFLHVMLEGWGIPRQHWEGAKANMRLRLEIPGVSLFWGSMNGERLGGSILYARAGSGYLADAATVPTQRRMGCQRALIVARAAEAHARGCRELFGCARFGDSSFRNMQRVGLRLVSSDQTWHFRFADRPSPP
jgi:hypothetical protein